MYKQDMSKILLIETIDNVAITLINLPAKSHVVVNLSSIKSRSVVTSEDIPQGHKLALKDFAPGDWIIKYGERIGRAKCAIKAGAHVHIHNVIDITEELTSERRPKQ